MNRSLIDLAPGEAGIVVLLEGGYGMQRRLRSLGIVEGNTVRVLSALAWGGPVVVEVNRARVAIGRGMARHVKVAVSA